MNLHKKSITELFYAFERPYFSLLLAEYFLYFKVKKENLKKRIDWYSKHRKMSAFIAFIAF